uniref:Uncharacterized protein n=1 Tax=Nelumbo nucifera TaxID=4432 RepID=A0A822XVM1_NELNU|nr:TPA_asm: hypothetical protein HUJ06_022941 [Nelumbo nucifera]
MVIHLVAAVKLPLLGYFKLSPLFWPFNLYLPLARHLPGICTTISTASSLLALRLRQIIGRGLHHHPNGQTRMERAFRLFVQEIFPPQAPQRPDTVDETTFHELLSISL